MLHNCRSESQSKDCDSHEEHFRLWGTGLKMFVDFEEAQQWRHGVLHSIWFV